MKKLHMVAYLLMFAGGINWGLIGLFDFDLVEAVFGQWPGLVTLVYVLVGLSTVFALATHKKTCNVCSQESMK